MGKMIIYYKTSIFSITWAYRSDRCRSKWLDGSIESVGFDEDIYFGFQIPKSLDDVESDILNPLNAWSDVDLYNRSAKNLVAKFKENYKKYDLGDDKIRKGGPY